MAPKRELGLLDVFCIATGAMISSGLFVLPGLAFEQAGPSVVLSYLFAGLLAMMGMLSQAELVSAMPKAGGDYFYVTRSMGPAVGTVDGLMTWLALSLKSAFALVGVAAFAGPLLGTESAPLVAVPLCLLFVGLNLTGVKEAGRVQVALVMGLLTLLLLYVAYGVSAVSVLRFQPFVSKGLGPMFATAGLVFVSYGGLLKVASVAEEVRNPSRIVPLGMFLSMLTVGVLYLLTVLVTVGTLDADALSGSLTPISDAAGVFLGSWGRVTLAVAAILAFVSTANAGIMAASRYPVAASRDELLPPFVQETNARFGTPHYAILMTGGVMLIAVFLKLKILVEVASCVLIMTFVFSCLSVILLRESRIQNYQPRFRAPLYPWLQIVGVVSYALLLVQMGGEALLASLTPVAAGLFIYWFHGRMRTNREYALLHLLQRITAREMTTGSLGAELREVIRERDEITKDRFDHLVEDCVVVDIDHAATREEVFDIVSKALEDRLEVPAAELHRKMIEREEQSSTAITPTLAIPHIIIEGEKHFDLALVRCKQGIRFSDTAPDIQAIFFLIGTMDERNFHLRALSAIAQIVQDPHFERRWREARTKQDLRDVVLLGERRR